MIQKNWLDLIKPFKLNLETLEDKSRRAKITAEPLERGFGLTLGVALRRVLLSSLQGAAVTGILIEGAQHEFTFIRGVCEDVTDIILNLKSLALRKHGTVKRVLHLQAEGPGPITAALLQPTADVEILDPDVLICTLDKGAKISMEITVESGRGYVPAEQLRRPDSPVGYIPVDALFSPVRKVEYRVENTRVGQKTDYDKLILDVETNGATKPEDAVALAARILQDQFQRFVNFEEPKEERIGETDSTGIQFNKNLLRRVEELELSVRAANCLKHENIVYIGDLVSKSEQDLLRTPNFGRKSLNEIKGILVQMGLGLGMGLSDWPPENVEELAKKVEDPY